jgi:diacylglycerol kinase family enzyme
LDGKGAALMAFKKIHLIVNPASGQPKPILHIVNNVLHKHAIDWNVSVTHTDGSGAQLAQEAVQAGADLVTVCGGDGTVKDVINGLMAGEVPLAILPGGTGNALAHELNILWTWKRRFPHRRRAQTAWDRCRKNGE